MKRFTKVSLALATSMSAVAAGFGTQALQASAADGNTIVYSQYQPFDNVFIPQLSSIAYTGYITAFAFDNLFTLDKNYNLTNDLAQSYVWSADKKSLTITIKKNAKWSDGQPITSDDVLLFMNYLASPAYNNQFQGEYESEVADVVGADSLVKGKATSFANTGGFKKISDKQFKVTFSVQNPHEMLFNVLFWTPLPSHILGKIPISEWQNNAYDREPTVSSGAYVIDQVNGTDTVHMHANPYYVFGKPKIAYQVWKTVNPDVTPGELQSGQIDYDLNGLQPSDMPSISQFSNITAHSPVDQGYYYMGLKDNQAYFKNVKVRQAITYAINRNAIVKGVVKGYGVVANGPLTPAQWSYIDAKSGMNPYNYSPSKASKLLDQAGWKKDSKGWRTLPGTSKEVTLTLGYPSTDPQRTAAATEVAQDLQKVGIHVDLKTYPKSSGMYTDVEGNKLNMWMGGWLNLGAVQDIKSLWSIKSAYNSGFQDWNDKTNEKLIAAAYSTATYNTGVYASALKKWQKYVNQQMPIVFLWDDDLLYAINKRVHIPSNQWQGAGFSPLHPETWTLQ